MRQIIVTATVDGDEIHRQKVRESEMQGVVSMAAYNASIVDHDPSSGNPGSFPKIVITVEEYVPPVPKAK